MSKPMKDLMKKDLARRLDGVDSLAICEFTGLDAEGTTALRARLDEKKINVTIVKNSIARNVFKDRGEDQFAELFQGPCAIAWGGESVVDIVRELKDIAKQLKSVEIKSAVLSGDVFDGKKQIEALSKFPTRDEAIGQVVQCVIACGANVASSLVGPSGQIAGILKTIEEKGE